jgi:hypothetical protein
MARHRVIAREPRHCSECGKELRKYYNKNEYVCGHPKVTQTQSQCQLDRSSRLKTNNQALNTVGRECKICGEVMIYKANANQEICNRPKNIRYLFVHPKTPCQIKNQRTVEADWKKDQKENPRQKTEEELIEETIDNVWLPALVEPIKDGIMRRCLGMLSSEEFLGDHWFKSDGPHNRQCPECVEAKERNLEYDNIRADGPYRYTGNVGGKTTNWLS